MKFDVSAYLWLSLLPIAHASYQVILNDDSNCKGNILSSHQLSVEDGCQNFGVGKAQGARLEREQPIDVNDEMGLQSDTLLFYSSPDCNSTSGDIIASTDLSCVAVGGRFTAQQFQSFRLVSQEMSKAGERFGWKESNAALISHGLTWADLETQGSKMHGRIFVSGGEVYRFQQVASGSWRGVRLEEWDDEVHVRYDEVAGTGSKEREVGGHNADESAETQKADSIQQGKGFSEEL